MRALFETEAELFQPQLKLAKKQRWRCKCSTAPVDERTVKGQYSGQGGFPVIVFPDDIVNADNVERILRAFAAFFGQDTLQYSVTRIMFIGDEHFHLFLRSTA